MIRKFLAVLLCFIFFTTACGQTTVNEENNVNVEVALNLDGYECVIYVDRPTTENLFGYKLDMNLFYNESVIWKKHTIAQ